MCEQIKNKILKKEMKNIKKGEIKKKKEKKKIEMYKQFAAVTDQDQWWKDFLKAFA